MRVIKVASLENYARVHARARVSLRVWLAVVRKAAWANYVEVRQTFSSADLVTLPGRRTVTIFNIAGNEFRLITAIHFVPANPVRGRIYIREFLTHADYSRNEWKERH